MILWKDSLKAFLGKGAITLAGTSICLLGFSSHASFIINLFLYQSAENPIGDKGLIAVYYDMMQYQEVILKLILDGLTMPKNGEIRMALNHTPPNV